MKAKYVFRSVLCATVLGLGAFNALQAHASIVIAATRVIYPAKEREVMVKLSNEGKGPRLTQVWIDNGDERAGPAAQEVPFTIAPPVARIDPGKTQTLRVSYTGEALPQDRESVFWLNVLDIPPQVQDDGVQANLLQVAVRSRIKLFFRPAGLPGTAEEAPARIQWRVVPGGIEARNPSAYHVSFTEIEVVSSARTATFDEGGMVSPGQTTVFPLKGDVQASTATKVRSQAINDYGGVQRNEIPLLRH
ncbi:fimbria/pilus periplasmic chaperone [Achromobacter sp. Bel]|uniref:fimbrial biogenesis chaperone n=1 Tax=Achromobacter sp. Bel TaxID=2727415 RepID=UPI00145E2350|nr:fimbria/pilus periplasmic chaperone [Achromobacter sp. Bel]NMK47215.1 fimbria/pilus periplasmic chaperone [Achromobacter sp. Bel]